MGLKKDISLPDSVNVFKNEVSHCEFQTRLRFLWVVGFEIFG